MRLFLVAYGLILFWLLPKLSLWLDEILDMMGSSKPLPEVIRWAAINPGGVPLGYLIHWAAFQMLGMSAFSVRLTSAMGSLVACAGIYVVGKRAGLRAPILAAIALALLPLQFRYALEARPYAIALAIAVWAMVLFDRIVEKPTPGRLAAYGLLGVCGLYVQPYSVFVLVAQGSWVLGWQRRLAIPVLGVQAGVVAAFLPWVLYAGAWETPLSIIVGDQATGWRSLGLVAHEITGMGYPGTILMALGVAAGARAVSIRSLWLLYLMAPIAGALALDMAFGYFLAIRQMMYALIPMAILFVAGVESLAMRRPKLAAGLLAAMLAGSIYADTKMFFRPRENWKGAARELESEVSRGGCVVFVPANSEVYYTFFSPALSAAKCPVSAVASGQRVAVAVSPDARPMDLAELESRGLPASKSYDAPPYVRVFSTR